MTTKLQRTATAVSGLLLLALVTVPGSHAFANPPALAAAAGGDDPCSLDSRLIDFAGPRNDGLMASVTNDPPSVKSKHLAEEACDNDRLGPGGGPGGGSDCAAFVSGNSQGVAQGMAASAVFLQDQIEEAVQQVQTSLTEMCGDGDVPITPACHAHNQNGVASVVCVFCCSWRLQHAIYRVMAHAVDSSPTVPEPPVYGAVHCNSNWTPVPPFGVSCAGEGYCSNDAEGVKWLYGTCIHLASGENPKIVDRDCQY